MAKKTKTTEVSEAVVTPAVRRSRTAKPAATTKTAATKTAVAKATATRRPAAPRTTRTAAVAADRGLTPAVTAEVLATVGPEPAHDEIATRAYFIHLRRHGAAGSPEHDWLLAIEELRRERGLI